MKHRINKVSKFHKVFEIAQHDEPNNLSFDDVQLRCKLLYEELKKYEEAALEEDLVGIADALANQLYIVFGTILKHGMGDIIVDVFDEVHRSNMSKLGADGKPIINGINGANPEKPIGKILKGENFKEPDIESILKSWL